MSLFQTGSGKPRVILGLMTFGPDETRGARITTLSSYTAILDYLQSHGYYELDTARIYVGGKQEAFTQEAKWKERGFKLATKVWPNQPGWHKNPKLSEEFNISLKELGTDCVDIFYLHAPDRGVPFEETLEAVNELHKQGKFVQLGLSNFPAFEVAEIVMTCKYHGWVRPTIYQGMYNAITRGLEPELIPTCRRYGIDVVIYNPLAGGLFSGKYTLDQIPDEGRFSAAVGDMGEQYRERYFRDSFFGSLKLIEPAVKKAGLAMTETALRWCVHHSALRVGGVKYLDDEKNSTPLNDGIIIGVSSQAQLEANLRDLEKGPLPEEVVNALDQAWKIAMLDQPEYWRYKLEYGYDTKKALFPV